MKNFFKFYEFFSIPFALMADGNGSGGGSPTTSGSGLGGIATSGATAAGAANSSADPAATPVASAAAVPSADFRTYVNADGTIANPDGFFGNESTHLSKRFTSSQALAKSYVSLERQLSNSNKVAVPNENSTDEEWNAFFAKAGRPDKPEGYELVAPEGVAKQVWNEQEVKDFSGLAHKLGLSKKSANALVSWQAERLGKAYEAQTQMAEQAKIQTVDSLKKEWGGDFDKNVELAKKAAQTFGGDELLNHPLSNDPAFIKAMAKAGASISEDKLAGGRGSANAASDPSSVREEIGQIMSDRSNPYWLPKHPNHALAVSQVKRLYEKLHPAS
jgi:hypothetical protein